MSSSKATSGLAVRRAKAVDNNQHIKDINNYDTEIYYYNKKSHNQNNYLYIVTNVSLSLYIYIYIHIGIY